MNAELLKSLGATDEEIQALKDWQNKKSEEEISQFHKERLDKFTSSECHRLMAELEYLTLTDELIEKIRSKYVPRGADKYTSIDLAKEFGYGEEFIKKILKPDFQYKNYLPKGADTYVLEKVIAIKTNGKGVKEYSNKSMEDGSENEPKAVERFEKEKGVKCYATGDEQVFSLWTKYFGGHPDGLFGKLYLIEIKCPDSKTHFFRLINIKNQQDLKKHEPTIYWQIQGNLLATKRKKGFFIDFDERFDNPNEQISIVEVNRDEEDIERLKTRIRLAEKRKQYYLKKK